MATRTRVAFVRCRGYCEDLGARMVELMAPLGGMGAFVRRGAAVLVKPNLLTSRAPEAAVTTHPEVVRAVVRLVRECGGEPRVGDSPVSVTRIERVWQATGVEAVCREEGVPLLNFEESGSVAMERDGMRFSIARPVLEADLVISLPKVKTHVLTIFTGAVKNLYGTVPGLQKATLHKLYPRPAAFGELLAAVYAAVRPGLSIADGVVGMDGDGPSGGRPVPLGFLAASPDGVALDATLCRLLGIDLRAVPWFAPLARQGIGTSGAAHIALDGARPDDLRPAAFRVPGTLRGRLIPGWLVKALAPWLWFRPVFSEACVRCGRCVTACPVQALALDGEGPPALNAHACIGCCCCHEVCPANAVTMRQSPLLSVLRGGRAFE